MKQVITKNGKIMCVTTVPYTPEMLRQIKKAGYKVKEVLDDGSADRVLPKR